jgi:outer membrane protein assembly factor BamB
MLAAVAAAIAVAGLAPAVSAAASAPAASLQWTAAFAVKNHDAAGNATAVSPDGRTVFVTGSALGGSDTGSAETIAYNAATGAVVWQATFSPTSNDSGFSSIAVSPNGSTVFVTGYTGNPNQGLVQAIVAYNAATGAEQWQVIGTALAGAAASPVVVSPDNSTVYVTNAEIGTTGQTAAYNATTGAPLWTQPAGGDAIALPSGATTLFVTGEPNDFNREHTATQAFQATTGATVWQATDSTATSLTAAGLSPDGAVLFVSGVNVTGPVGKTTTTFTTVAYSAASGTQRWAVSTGSARGGGVHGLAVTPDGSALIVSENSENAHSVSHWLTLALNPQTGAAQWTRANYDKSFSLGIFASVLALSPDGSTAYVTGYSDQYVTIGYNTTTGTPVWTARYDGQLNNFAYASAVSPDGSQVFVTGASNGGTGAHPDVMTTVAYSTT